MKFRSPVSHSRMTDKMHKLFMKEIILLGKVANVTGNKFNTKELVSV